jgi:AcrR family transcriptional regulator
MALDVLVETGGEELTVHTIASELGVTYGALYHHFRSADDFFRAVLKYWQKELLGGVAREHLKKTDASLASLMETLVERGLPKYDLAIRQWAKTYVPAAQAVKKADTYRMDLARRLLENRGQDAETARARGEMIISMHIGNLAHPDPERRGEAFKKFVEMADRLD